MHVDFAFESSWIWWDSTVSVDFCNHWSDPAQHCGWIPCVSYLRIEARADLVEKGLDVVVCAIRWRGGGVDECETMITAIVVLDCELIFCCCCLLFNFLQLCCPVWDFWHWKMHVTFLWESLLQQCHATQPRVHAGLFCVCFHNPPNSDMDDRIFQVHICDLVQITCRFFCCMRRFSRERVI